MPDAGHTPCLIADDFWSYTHRRCGAQAAKLAGQLKVPEGALWAVSPLTRAVQTFLLARGRPGASPACDSAACTRLPAKVRPLLSAFCLRLRVLGFMVPAGARAARRVGRLRLHRLHKAARQGAPAACIML